MRALVTGSLGFAGSFLIEHLVASGDDVAGTYLATPKPDDFPCKAFELDITDENSCRKVIEAFKPDILYHLAGVSFVPEAERNFARVLAVNVGGTHNLCKACYEMNPKIKFVLVSSAQVYGKVEAEHLPIREYQAVNPNDNYSLCKAMGEMVARRFGSTRPDSLVIMRPFNHVGPGQRVHFVVSNFAHQLVQIKLGNVPAVMRVGNLEAKRDITDVRDIIKAYRLAALTGYGVYNLCSGNPVSIQELLDTLIEISGVNVKIELDPARLRLSDTPILYGSYEKAKKELGWEPQISLRQSLVDSYEYWLKVCSK